jgi:hypothetical protein
MMDQRTGQQVSDYAFFKAMIYDNMFLDYGVVTKVTDNARVDVTHAAIEVLLDGTELPAVRSKDVEILWPASSGFSMQNEIAIGDQVLLLGLKSYVPAVADVDGAKVPKSFDHYNRATLKAIPLCSFNSEAACVVKSTASKTTINANALEINGNTKELVTHAELNTALQGLVTALMSHTHNCTAPGTPSGPPLAALSLDISASKTTTIKTGG